MIPDRYLARAKEFLRAVNPRVEETPFGYAIIKGNWRPSSHVECVQISNYQRGVRVGTYLLDLKDRVLHERVLVIERPIPIRSHEEIDHEIVENIGDSNVHMRYRHKGGNETREFPIAPGDTILSVNGPDRFFHGFFVKDTGLLYVVKALKPEFVEGDSFRIPENAFRE